MVGLGVKADGFNVPLGRSCWQSGTKMLNHLCKFLEMKNFYLYSSVPFVLTIFLKVTQKGNASERSSTGPRTT